MTFESKCHNIVLQLENFEKSPFFNGLRTESATIEFFSIRIEFISAASTWPIRVSNALIWKFEIQPQTEDRIDIFQLARSLTRKCSARGSVKSCRQPQVQELPQDGHSAP